MEYCHLFTAMTSAQKHTISPQARIRLVLEAGWGILAKPPTGLILKLYLQPLAVTEEEKLNISRRLSAESTAVY